MAIALDTSSTGAAAASWSHTCTGSNLLLLVGAIAAGGTGDSVTGVTYNSVSMTQLVKVQTPTNRWIYLFGLLAPTTGSNTVAISTSSGTGTGSAVSYTNVAQTGLPDATASNTASASSSLTTAITTVADNCWAALWSHCDSASAPVASTNVTQRQQDTASQSTLLGDSNGVIHPAGSFSMTVTAAGSNDIAAVVASFAPHAVVNNTKTVTGSLSFTGAISKNIATKKTAALTFSGALTAIHGQFVTLTAALSFVGTMTKKANFFKTLTAKLSFSGVLTQVANLLRRFRPSTTLYLTGPNTTKFIT